MHSQQPPPEERQNNSTPKNPTATAPDSVEESVYEEAAYAGKDGPTAASPATAKNKNASTHND